MRRSKLKLKSFTIGSASIATAIGLAMAAPAHAGATADFSGCDGLKKPKRSDDGMRGEATMPAYNLTSPGNTIASCNRAFERRDLRDHQTLRRAHMLRARAAAYLQNSRIESALADIAEARAATESYAGEPFYDRSMGISLDLLEALALGEKGQLDEAVALADRAVETRPYALQVQRAAALIRMQQASETGGTDDVWGGALQIDPDLRELAARFSGRSNDGFDAEATIAELPEDGFDYEPFEGSLGGSLSSLEAEITRWSRSYSRAADIAFAYAASGRPDEAQALIDEVRAALQLNANLNGEDADRPPSPTTELLSRRVIEPDLILAEGRIAIARGDLEGARERLSDREYRSSAKSRELHAAYEAANSALPEPYADLPALASSAAGQLNINILAPKLLFKPESERELIDYERSRPNILGAIVGGALSLGTSLLGGINRTDGFASEENEDGTLTVKFTGDTTSGPMVQEMTLLRAAEVARENGATHFEILSRSDFQRYVVQTLYGVEQSRTLRGYRTELEVRLLEEEQETEISLDAVEIIDALGPVYYQG